MGADLYIDSLYKKNQKKYEPLFRHWVAKRDAATNEDEKKSAQENVSKYYDKMYSKGYFSDSYNATSLLWVFNLSWWKDIKINAKGHLTVEESKNLLAIISSKKIPSGNKFREYITNKSGATVDDKENSPEAWRKFFVNKRKRFIKFLETAIKLHEDIVCSV